MLHGRFANNIYIENNLAGCLNITCVDCHKILFYLVSKNGRIINMYRENQARVAYKTTPKLRSLSRRSLLKNYY